MLKQILPAEILYPLQPSLEEIKDDFLKYIFEINDNKKPVWTILKELKETIPYFIEKYLFTIILDTATDNQTRIKELQRKLPNKSLLNCRNIINSVISLIESEGLTGRYVQSLLKIIISNDERKYDSSQSARAQKQIIKCRLLALMLVVYQFTPEKRKLIFNIVDLWYKVYPETPICSFKDTRILPTQTIIEPKLKKKAKNQQVDSTQMELEWLEREFQKNLKISAKSCSKDDEANEGEEEDSDVQNHPESEQINLEDHRVNELQNQLDGIQIEQKSPQETHQKEIGTVDWPSCWIEASDQSAMTPLSAQLYNPLQDHTNMFQTPVKTVPAFNLQTLNSAPSAFYYQSLSTRTNNENYCQASPKPIHQTTQKQQQQLQPLYSGVILRNPSHQIFDQQIQDAGAVSFNFFIQSQ